MITDAVRAQLADLSDESLPAYLYDLAALTEHVRRVRSCLPDEVELYYAAKANPDAPILRAVAELVDGVEVASGGELAHVRATLPTARLAFGGPAKSAGELAAGLTEDVHRFHVESAHELRLLDHLATRHGRVAEVLLRVNFPIAVAGGAQLAMGGRPSPFGLDPAEIGDCVRFLRGSRHVRLAGLHAHLASGLDAPAHLATVGRIAEAAVRLAASVDAPLAELNLGGGMAVDYAHPAHLFDWWALGAGLRDLAAELPGTTLRIEPGRALTAYCGWYAATVADVKHSAGKAFAVLSGGTHHLRTPVTKAHDQPFDIVPNGQWDYLWPRPEAVDEPVTIAGQLCTPKDVLATDVPVTRIRAGDRVVFGMAGAYAWNISHHEFLMHRRPSFHYLPAHDPVPTGA